MIDIDAGTMIVQPLGHSLIERLSARKIKEDSSLDFKGSDTQYATHCLHTYLAAMVPQLAKTLVQTYVPAGGTVMDPFCGGGGVLVEAILNGKQAIGYDINDLALLVSKAKTTHLDRESIKTTGYKILENAKNYSGPIRAFDKSENVGYWFKPYMFAPLSALRASIEEIKEEQLSNLFRVIFSATVRNVSLTYRNEIRLRKMTEEEQESFNPDVFQKFEDKLKEATIRVSELPQGAKAQIRKLDIKNLQLPIYANTADTIICSPPYGDERNGVPYTQFAKNMLFWLGYTSQQVKESKDLSLGWGNVKRSIPHSKTLIEAVDRIKKYSDSVDEATNFYADYFEALKGMSNAAKDRIIIVIGQRVLMNTIFDNGRITAELMAEIGVSTESIFERRLPSKRLPKMRDFGAAINRETILIFKK